MLNIYTPDFIPPTLWPPNSYKMWSVMQGQVHAVNDLKQRLLDVWATQGSEDFRQKFHKFKFSKITFRHSYPFIYPIKCYGMLESYCCFNFVNPWKVLASYFRRRLQPRLCNWSRLSQCLVYFQHRMAVLDFYQGNRFSQRKFRMSHFSKKGSTTQLYLGSDSAFSAVAGWATS